METLKIIRYLAISGVFHFTMGVMAQINENPGSSIVSELLEELASSEIEFSDIEEISEDLSYLLDHPLNLNLAGEEELKRLHILNDFQIYTLLEYVREYGPILSLSELQTVIGFSPDVINKIQAFVIVQSIPEQVNIHSRYINQEFIFKYAADLQKNQNFVNDSLTNMSVYLGKNRSMKSRYQIKSGTAWRAGLTMEQDPGEAFKPPGKSFRPDFASAFIELNNPGLLNYLIIGDFKTSYGQGLVLSNYPQRKGSTVLLKPGRSGIRKYSSTGENDFFRGAGFKLKHKNFALEIFYSRLMRDATIYFDTCRFIKSLSASGLHRTAKELEKKDVLMLTGFGTHAVYKTRILDVGFTFFGQKMNTDYLTRTDPFLYKRIKKGDAIFNVSTDYKLNLNKVLLFGELACDYKGRVAFLNGLLAELHPLVRYSFLFRRYHPSYMGVEAGGFGEKSDTRNEEGIYMGMEIYPWKNLKLDIFADHYKLPFPDISSTGPSSGNEYYLNCCLTSDNKYEFHFRFRFEKNQDRSDRPGPLIDLMDNNRKISNRFEFKSMIFTGLVLKSRTEWSYYSKSGSEWTKGYYCGNDLGYEPVSSGCKFWIRYAVFDIPGWDNRIYAYENDVLYSFSTPVFNNKGSRVVFLSKISLTEKAEFWIRYSSSIYVNVSSAGIGNDQLSNKKTPFLSLQLRIKI